MAGFVQELNGRWQFKEYPVSARRMRDLDGENGGGWNECTVPNSVFTNLIEAGVVERFDIEANPEKYEWVSDKPWVYRKVFETDAGIINSERVELICDGLDTIASVWLNEKLIGRTNNMFVDHRFDVTEYLKTGQNSLTVKFDPAAVYAEKLMERNTPFSGESFRNPCRAYIRKAQYQFGWDWCPAFIGCGIWRDIRLEGVTSGQIKNLHVRTVHCDEKSADIRLAVELDRISNAKYRFVVDVYDPEGKAIEQLELEPHGISDSIVFHIKKPRLWMPRGYGKPNLYRVEVKLFANGEIVDNKQCNFGIRTVKLNRSEDKGGNKFQFEINGVPVYAKGADWIPASVFAGSVRRDDYERLIKSAAEANMNMLRVWGGGYYEADHFYKLCDKLGIMVWQDFMFACCYYPDRKWFWDMVEVEARSVIGRLWNHPSLVLWCGNNEIDWIHQMLCGKSGKRMHGKKIWHKLLPKVVCELDPDRPYVYSTPCSDSAEHNDPNSGSVHNWEVWAGYKPVNAYITDEEKVPRFVTEFGFQSPPRLETVKQFCKPEQVRLASKAIEKHNYQVDGNSRVYKYLGALFGQARDLEQFIYLSQITQARAIRAYAEYLRAHNERNSGVLFWQFNDSCPAISWSAIDYSKHPKALYYYAKRFYRPLLLTVVPELDRSDQSRGPKLVSLSVVLVNDTQKPLTGNIICDLIDLSGNILDSIDLPVTAGPLSASRPTRLAKGFVNVQNPQRCALRVRAQANGDSLAETLYFYLPDKYIDWPRVNIERRLNIIDDHRAQLELTADALAKDVCVQCEDIETLSDNYIDLLPGQCRKIEIHSKKKVTDVDDKIRLVSVNSALRY